MSKPVSITPHLYVHAPFCQRKCPYCDFYSREIDVNSSESLARYVEAVARERRILADAEGVTVRTPTETVYVGGGTPSLLGPALLKSALGDVIDRLDETEFTVEANPESASDEVIDGFIGIGVNRISIGAQSFDDRLLTVLGRTHNAATARNAIERAGHQIHDANGSLSIDLIYAIPGGSLDDWLGDLELAVSLAPDHISAYALTYYEGTRLLQSRDMGAITPATEDLEAAMFELAHAKLTDNGYEHYEISNYARPGHACQHNSAIWRGESYLGLGPSAHSRVAGRRWNNPADLDAYLGAVESGRLPRVFGQEPEPGRQWRAERLMLGLRTSEGENLTRWSDCDRDALASEHGRLTTELVDEGMATSTPDRLSLTPKGWLLYDAIVARLF